MKYTKRLFKVVLLIACSFVTSQYAQDVSVHAEHIRQFRQPSQSISSSGGGGIIPLQYDKSKKIGASIFGYLPDWEYLTTTKEYIRYDIITHLAAFDFAVGTTGTMTLPSGWPWTDVINKAHQNGVKMILCVTNFDGDQIHTIISTASVRQTFFSKLNQYIQQYSFDGVNIDFEDLNTADKGTAISGFMAQLSAYLKSYYPNCEVSFAGPALTSNWDIVGLASACDYIFIMGYAFWGSWSSTTGACAPLTSGSINITNTVLTQYSAVTNTNPQKLILGVPYYGLKWKAVSNQPHATVRKWVSSTRFRDDALNAPNYGIRWAADQQVPWYTYPADTGYYQIWYDNDTSLGLKYALAQAKNYRGVGMWALGYDGARPELWNELYKRFILPQSAAERGGQASDYTVTLTSFPNPANPSCVISISAPYRLSSVGDVVITDILGKRIRVIPVDGAGAKTSVRWDGIDEQGDNVPSGIYICSVRAAGKSVSAKIVLLK